MAEELDIFEDTTGLSPYFSVDDINFDALAGFSSGINHEENEFTALHTNHRGYIGEDGNIYRKELTYNKQTGEFEREYTDERLYFWTPPQELGDRGLNADPEVAAAGRDKFGAAGLYTEAEIREAWEAKEGMGYLKKANPGLTFDKYFSFIEETTALFTDPEYDDLTDGNMVAGNFQDSPEYMAMMEEYGIKTQYVNSDGDVFNWNGTGYSKDFKVDDSIDIGAINKMALGLIGSFVAGPIIANALTPALGAAGAKAASAAITSMASQLATDGEIDFADALVSAAVSYGGAKMGNLVNNPGILGEVGEKVSGVTDKFKDFITTGNSIANAAIKAGGMSLLTQFVTTGEIDPMQAGIAALMAGGTQAFQDWTASMYNAGEPVSDDLLQEITVEAKRVGNDLGNGMYELDGVVFSEEGGYLGNMADLDLNGDGALSGEDLQNITTPDRELVDPTIRPDNNFGYEMGDDVYVDANGNPVDPNRVKFGPDGYVVDGQPVTTKPYNEVFGGDKGGLEWRFGLNEDGSVSDTDGAIYYENGELAYEKVDGQWVDAYGNIIDDPVKVDELTMVAAKAIDAPLESIEYFDQDGNVINYKYLPYELRDNLEDGQFSGLIFGPNGEVQEVWYDPITNTEYIKSDQGFQGVEKVEPPPEKTTKPAKADDQGADQTKSESTASGQGSGPTQATGGQAGDAGKPGGATGGATAGGQGGMFGVGSGGGFIPSAGAGTDTTGTQTTGDSTAQGTGVSATDTAGTGGVAAGTDAGTGQGGEAGAASGAATGTGDAGADAGADTGTGQATDTGVGAGAGTDAGTGGVVGGGAGEVAGGGTGDQPGTGAGSGGAGLGSGSGGGFSGAGGQSSFSPFMSGLSYQPIEPIALYTPPQKDYVSELNDELDALIQRNLGGMFKEII